MKKLVLDKRDSGALLAVDSNVVLVVGGDDVDVLLQYAILDTKSSDAGNTCSVSRFNDFDNDDALNIWNYLKDDQVAVKLFLSFLKILSSSHDDVSIKSDGTILVGDKSEEFSYTSLDDMTAWYKSLFDIALKAFIVSNGCVFINNVDLSLRVDTYKSLFDYLAKMGAYRNNKIFISTDNMDTFKGFLQFIEGDADASATLITMKGNKGSNSNIYAVAGREHKAARDIIRSLDMSV